MFVDVLSIERNTEFLEVKDLKKIPSCIWTRCPYKTPVSSAVRKRLLPRSRRRDHRRRLSE